MILKIEVSSLRRRFKIRCIIFFRNFIELWMNQDQVILIWKIAKIQTTLEKLKNFSRD